MNQTVPTADLVNATHTISGLKDASQLPHPPRSITLVPLLDVTRLQLLCHSTLHFVTAGFHAQTVMCHGRFHLKILSLA